MNDEKQLDKIDIASELKILSPIEAKSIELKKQADEAEISDKVTYVAAKKIKKALISHRTSTKDLRLTFTRKLDNLKDQFIKKQDEVLEASLAGEEVIKEKVTAWEKLEQDRKDAENKRIKAILDKIYDVPPMSWKTATLDDIKRERARLKMERGLLAPNDRTKVLVKDAINKVNTDLAELEEHVIARIEQELVAEEQRVEAEKLAAERKQLNDHIAQGKKAIFGDTPEGIEMLRSGNVVEPKFATIGIDLGTPEGDTSILSDAAKKYSTAAADELDHRLQNFLIQNGIRINPQDIEGSRKELSEKGYQLDMDRETIAPEEGEVSRSKTTFTLSKVIDTYSYETVMKIGE